MQMAQRGVRISKGSNTRIRAKIVAGEEMGEGRDN